MKLILIVDDDQAILDLLEAFLSERYNLLFSDNAIEAIKQSKNNKIDLLITDIRMPAMSGKELVDKIRQTSPDLKVLFVSGFITDKIIDKVDVDKNIDYIEKPFDREQLLEKIQNLLDE